MLRDCDIQTVKSSVTMADICRQYGFKINRSGFISCPFHGDDKHPSLKVYDGQRGWHCFVCQEGGDIISFVQRIDGLEFEPAVRHIAEMFGIPVSDGNTELTAEEKAAIVKQRQAREAAEKQRAADKKRLGELADLIKAYETYMDLCEPFSGLWCRLMERRGAVSAEWEELFNKE